MQALLYCWRVLNPCKAVYVPGVGFFSWRAGQAMGADLGRQTLFGNPEASQGIGRTGRWRRAISSLVAPVQQEDVGLGSSATINAQFWLGQFPLRPTAGWVVTAALLSVGASFGEMRIDWRELTLVLL